MSYINTVILKPTHRCNLNCSYCYDRYNREKDKMILSKENLVIALRKIAEEWDEFQAIWHGGEPTVLGVEYWRYVLDNTNDLNIHWNVQTNATLLNDEWMELFKKYNCEVGTSWDGINNKTRTNESNYFFNFIDLIKKYDITAAAIFTVTPDNYQDVFNTAIFALQNKINVNFNLVFDYYRTISESEYYEMAFGLANIFDLYCTIPDFQIQRPFDFINNWLLQKKPNLCENIICNSKWISINPNGDVGFCGKPWPSDLIYGNIFDSDFNLKHLDETKNGLILRDIQEKQWEHCKDCELLIYCNGGCPYNSINKQTLEYEFNEGYCFFIKTLMKLCISILKTRYLNDTLENQFLKDNIETSNRIEVKKWRNCKYPII